MRVRKPSITKLIKAARMYSDNLLNRNFLLVGLRGEDVSYLELRFLGSQFKHLTGVSIAHGHDITANNFLRICIDGRISAEDLAPDINGYTEIKLQASKTMFQHDLSASSFGVANGVRKYVQAEQYSGNTWASLGFGQGESPFLDPITMLYSPVRQEVLPKDRYDVVGVFSKALTESTYSRVEKLNASRFQPAIQSLPAQLQHVQKLTRQHSEQVSLSTDRSSRLQTTNEEAISTGTKPNAP